MPDVAACSGRARPGEMISGQKKSFHVPWKVRIVTAASAGPASGSITRQYVLK